MVRVNSLEIHPPLMNASCAWACEYDQLRELYDCPYIGAVTTRTAILNGFSETERNTVRNGLLLTLCNAEVPEQVVFDAKTGSTLNSYGYSPHPLTEYLSWVYALLTTPTAAGTAPHKPILVSITASTPTILEEMLVEIQDLRSRLHRAHQQRPVLPGAVDPATLIGVELNTSCPNIKDTTPAAYNFPLLTPLLDTLSSAFYADPTLTIGLKLPPYVYATRFQEVVRSISTYSRVRPAPGTDGTQAASVNPFAYLECTNTLGNSLFFADQVVSTAPSAQINGEASTFALPSPLGGLGGDAIHSLALGNVFSFAQLLNAHPDPAVSRIVIIGAGGVSSPEGLERMKKAGAKIVACATLLGRVGVKGFEYLSQVA